MEAYAYENTHSPQSQNLYASHSQQTAQQPWLRVFHGSRLILSCSAYGPFFYPIIFPTFIWILPCGQYSEKPGDTNVFPALGELTELEKYEETVVKWQVTSHSDIPDQKEKQMKTWHHYGGGLDSRVESRGESRSTSWLWWCFWLGWEAGWMMATLEI